MNFEPIFVALVGLMDNVSWTTLAGGGTMTFQVKSRRVKLWADCPAYPGCYQAEHTETSQQLSGMPYKSTLEVNWIIYHNLGKDESLEAATENNRILAAVRAALAPSPADPGYPQRNTLNGLVHHCFIDGRIFKDPGDLDGEGMLVVPIKLLVP